MDALDVKPQDETHPSEPTRATSETVNFAVDEVMVVREFGKPNFPSLVPMDAVTWHQAGDRAAIETLFHGRLRCYSAVNK